MTYLLDFSVSIASKDHVNAHCGTKFTTFDHMIARTLIIVSKPFLFSFVIFKIKSVSRDHSDS